MVERTEVAARGRALDGLARRLSSLTAESSEALDALLVVDATIAEARLNWLSEVRQLLALGRSKASSTS